MRQILVLAIALGPAGCFIAPDAEPTGPTSPPTSTPRHYDPPPGCTRTACDTDLASSRVDARTSCARCQSECSKLPIEYQLQCLRPCTTLCSSSDQAVSRCEDTAKGCRATSPRNAFCADRVTSACVPSITTPSRLPASITGQRKACTDEQITEFVDSCWSPTGTTTTCEAFVSSHPSCVSCAIGATGAEPLWSPKDGDRVWTNDGLCVAIRGDIDCGRKIFAADSCAVNACVSCADGIGACVSVAYSLSCAELTAAKDDCVTKLGPEVRAECVIPADTSEDFSVSAKRLIARACGG